MLGQSRSIAAVIVAFVTLLLLGLPFERTGSVSSVINFVLPSVTTAAIFALICIGLNIQWGYAGIFNFGIVAFFMIGSYVTAIVTKAPPRDEFSTYVGGYGPSLDVLPALSSDQWLPFALAMIASMAACALLALLLGLATLRLREDYLAIVLIGVAEILRRVVIQEQWLFNGTRGMPGIPRPFAAWVSTGNYKYVFLVFVAVVLASVFLLVEVSLRSPWGRALRAIREDEAPVLASGKSVVWLKIQAFVFGSALMGLGGSLYAMQQGAISPEVFSHFFGTFIFWAMLIVGGSGNTLGAVVGAYIIWSLWSITLQIQGYDLPSIVQGRVAYVRDFLLGVVIVVMLLFNPRGLIPERARVSRWLDRRVKAMQRAEESPAETDAPVAAP